ADVYNFLPLTGQDARFGAVGRANFEELIDRGIPYWYQPASNLYTSLDQRYWADITALVDMQRRPELTAQLVWRQKSSMFDLILWAAVDDLKTFVELQRE